MIADLLSIVAQYRAGLEAEMTLLHQLEALSERQRQATLVPDFAALLPINDARDGMMANLVTIEHQLRPLRQAIFDDRSRLAHLPEFGQVVALHRQAAALVSGILVSDRECLEALKEIEEARSSAAAAMEKGETTLAAYRRVIAPSLTNATLVNRRG
jgi:hypothetical protein